MNKTKELEKIKAKLAAFCHTPLPPIKSIVVKPNESMKEIMARLKAAGFNAPPSTTPKKALEINPNDCIKKDVYVFNDICGYTKIINVNGELILKTLLNEDIEFVLDSYRSGNQFKYLHLDVMENRQLKMAEQIELKRYLSIDCDKNTLFKSQTEKFLLYRQRVLDAGFIESKHYKGRFFKEILDYTAFAINIHDFGTHLSVICGLCSTKDVEEGVVIAHFKQFGADTTSINLRYVYDTYDDSDVEKIGCEIKSVYDKCQDISKNDLLETVRELRKNFFNQIHPLFKPLGFKKKGSKWYKLLSPDLQLVFHAQKERFGEKYDFYYYIEPTNKENCNYYYAVDLGDRSKKFDWQLEPIEKILSYIENEILTEIKVIIDTQLDNLKKLPYFSNSWLTCPKKCPNCWVTKYLKA